MYNLYPSPNFFHTCIFVKMGLKIIHKIVSWTCSYRASMWWSFGALQESFILIESEIGIKFVIGARTLCAPLNFATFVGHLSDFKIDGAS